MIQGRLLIVLGLAVLLACWLWSWNANGVTGLYALIGIGIGLLMVALGAAVINKARGRWTPPV